LTSQTVAVINDLRTMCVLVSLVEEDEEEQEHCSLILSCFFPTDL